jgi:hypothetical protein
VGGVPLGSQQTCETVYCSGPSWTREIIRYWYFVDMDYAMTAVSTLGAQWNSDSWRARDSSFATAPEHPCRLESYWHVPLLIQRLAGRPSGEYQGIATFAT